MQAPLIMWHSKLYWTWVSQGRTLLCSMIWCQWVWNSHLFFTSVCSLLKLLTQFTLVVFSACATSFKFQQQGSLKDPLVPFGQIHPTWHAIFKKCWNVICTSCVPISHTVLHKWMSTISVTHLVNCNVLRTCLPLFLPHQMHNCTIHMTTTGPWSCFSCTCSTHAILFQYFQRPFWYPGGCNYSKHKITV